MKIKLRVIAEDALGNEQEIEIITSPVLLERNNDDRIVYGICEYGSFKFTEKGNFDAFARWEKKNGA